MVDVFSTFAGRYVSDKEPDKEKTAIRLKSFLCCFELDAVGSFFHELFDLKNSYKFTIRTFSRMDFPDIGRFDSSIVRFVFVIHATGLQGSSNYSGSFVSELGFSTRQLFVEKIL